MGYGVRGRCDVMESSSGCSVAMITRDGRGRVCEDGSRLCSIYDMEIATVCCDLSINLSIAYLPLCMYACMYVCLCRLCHD